MGALAPPFFPGDWMSSLLPVVSDLSLLALEPPGRGASLLRGLVVTLSIACGSYTLGLLIGSLAACGKLYGNRLIRDMLEVYTTFVRAVPELVFILLFYYAGTDLLNYLLNMAGLASLTINGLVLGIVVLGLNQGAYGCEIIRGAIMAIPVGQIEAARAFGMSPFMTFRRVTAPAMLPHALPGLANLWLVATKETALLAVIGFGELTLATRVAATSTKHYMTFFLAAGLLYLVVSILSTIIFRLLERRYRRGLPEPV
jgi:polar amino acid transport system permease protein